MANKFRSKLLYGRSGFFNDTVGIGIENPVSGLHISGKNFRIDDGDAYFSNRPIVSGNSQVALLSDITGGLDLSSYYLSSNPSGYITGVDTSNFISASQTGQFYANSNPSGFINQNYTGSVSFSGTIQSSGQRVIVSDISNSTPIYSIVILPQSGYDALVASTGINANTLYFIS
jgi:hypothetical protein